jgi:hypothetical protein
MSRSHGRWTMNAWWRKLKLWVVKKVTITRGYVCSIKVTGRTGKRADSKHVCHHLPNVTQRLGSSTVAGAGYHNHNHMQKQRVVKRKWCVKVALENPLTKCKFQGWTRNNWRGRSIGNDGDRTNWRRIYEPGGRCQQILYNLFAFPLPL